MQPVGIQIQAVDRVGEIRTVRAIFIQLKIAADEITNTAGE
ncbi:MAG: hypothetical protein BWX84_00765 [Verrucomicrobia bacterium ADurb.Bin118]|nr:MAG: hypothetical protein BWX84_00765 [Verrucomicrobia bacterium ADurb.Bin118]